MTIHNAAEKARDLHSALQSLQKQAIAEKRGKDAVRICDILVRADDIVEVLVFMDRTALLPEEGDV